GNSTVWLRSAPSMKPAIPNPSDLRKSTTGRGFHTASADLAELLRMPASRLVVAICASLPHGLRP
ncbi:hypothetical protein, partial [Cereibacter azotoformans]|uniref:hypothetical protein n=1 Tax=Cereibacter azotoformans TaxID=43057 RepID=UPI00195FD815